MEAEHVRMHTTQPYSRTEGVHLFALMQVLQTHSVIFIFTYQLSDRLSARSIKFLRCSFVFMSKNVFGYFLSYAYRKKILIMFSGSNRVRKNGSSANLAAVPLRTFDLGESCFFFPSTFFFFQPLFPFPLSQRLKGSKGWKAKHFL